MSKNTMSATFTRNGEEFDFNFYTVLSAKDKIRFVRTVTDLLVGENYDSIVRGMMFDFTIISIFTDIDISEITNPNNQNAIGMIEDLVYGTNIVETVKNNIENDLITNLNRAVDENIAFRTGVHRNVVADAIEGLLNTLETKISGLDIEGMMQAVKILNKSSGELTPNNLMKAYVESDAFKLKFSDSKGREK